MIAKLRLLLPFAVLVLAVLACTNPIGPQVIPTQDPGLIGTLAAQTVVAQFLTQTAQVIVVEPSATLPPAVLEATATPTETLPPPTQTFTPTPLPTVTPLPSATPIPTAIPLPTSTPIPCLLAEFVKDVTVPDGTVFSPGTSFTKIWRVKNTGSCTWTRDYEVIHVRGDDLSGEDTNFPSSVQPGETVDLYVDMVAPNDEGDYISYWKLANQSQTFGVGKDGASLTAEIEVEEVVIKEGVVYSFANNFCAAVWSSDAGRLPCPGTKDDPDGFVIRLSEPVLENRTENEPALWTSPEQVKDGYITGKFPPVKIQDDDRFLADIGCLADSPKCEVRFILRYQIEGDKNIETVDAWYEIYDEKVTRVDIDLSPLDGKSVIFYLTVETYGPYREDNAFWLVPQIYRP